MASFITRTVTVSSQTFLSISPRSRLTRTETGLLAICNQEFWRSCLPALP